MKLGKTHLVAALAAMALASVYNVWSRGADSRESSLTSVAAVPMVGTPIAGVSGAAPVDPTALPPVPEVALDRLPEWPRNPFAPVGRSEPAPAVVEAAPMVEPPSDVVVATILNSPRRRIALVNGRRVQVGDRIGSETVVDILPDAIVLESSVWGRRTVERRSAGSMLGPKFQISGGGR